MSWGHAVSTDLLHSTADSDVATLWLDCYY